MKNYRLVLLLITCYSATFFARETDVLSSNVFEKQISVLEKEKREFARQTTLQDLELLAAEQNRLKGALEKASLHDREFIKKKLSLVMQDEHVVHEIEHMRQEMQIVLDEHMGVLNSYKEDPEFKKLKMPVKSTYNFDEFEDLGSRVLSAKARLVELEKNKTGAYEDLSKLKKALGALDEEYQEKTKSAPAFSSSPEAAEGLNFEQYSDIFDNQKRLIKDKKILAGIKVKEAEQRISLFDTQIMFTRAQLAVLKSNYERVKRALYVEGSYVRKAEAELEQKRHESSIVREKLHEEIKELAVHQEEIRRKATEVREQLGLRGKEATNGWQKTPRTIREWLMVCSMEDFALEEAVIELERSGKEASIEFEKAKMRKDEVNFAVIRSWHALTGRRLSFSSRSFEAQVKYFETLKAEIQGDLAVLTEKRTRAINSLSELNIRLEQSAALMLLLKDQKRTIFKDAQDNYNVCSEHLEASEKLIRQRLYLTAKLIESYSAVISTLEGTIKRIEHVVMEVDTRSFWRRSEQSITWDELKNFIPDIHRFLQDLLIGFSSYWSQLQITQIFSWVQGYMTLSFIALLLLRLIIILLIFWIIRTYLPDIRVYLISSRDYQRSKWRLFAAMCCNFLERHLIGLYMWSLLYVLITHEFIGHVYFVLFFYLISIPYMLYVAETFIAFFAQMHDQHTPQFISASYKPRFFWVVRLFAFSTIILFFFREAFMVGNYHASAAPTILLAINYIILQLALMSLVSKEWILSLIPRTTPLWEWVYDHVNDYYYVFWSFLMAIIIMSNPYVGYGRQVLYVLTRLFILGLLFPLFSFLYSRLRQGSADLFFYYAEGESIRERFASARAWYAIFVVVAFGLFVILGALIGTFILGYSIHLSDFGRLLRYELYSPGADELGRRLSVTPIVLMRVCLIIIGGIVATYVINNFILRRIFDPLMVTSGIQNTIFTLTRYSIIFLALLLGLRSVGLESFANKLLLILTAVGFVVKEPLFDFLSYFILLVQRPVKIGDFIKLDDDIMGIVRHITPRSVIIRKKNSVTLVVPNSQFITRSVINWNYTRTFFALNDIMITVPYSSDPDKVRAIIMAVLTENPMVLKSPAPLVQLNEFVDNGFQFLVRPFLTADKVLDQWEISSEVRLSLVRALRAQGIDVATPVRMIKVANMDDIALPK